MTTLPKFFRNSEVFRKAKPYLLTLLLIGLVVTVQLEFRFGVSTFLLFLLAPVALVISWYVSFRASLLFVIAGIISESYFLLDPYHSLSIGHSMERNKIIAFFVLSASGNYFLAHLRRSSTYLHHSLDKLGTVLNLVASGIAQVNAKTNRIAFVNQRLCKMVGYSEQELLTMTFDDITLEEDKLKSHHLFRQLVEGKVSYIQFEKRYRHKNGQIIWASIDASLIRSEDGQPVRTIAVIQDISDRKRAEALAHESEIKFKQFIENMPQLVWIANKSGSTVYFNKVCYTYLGVPPDSQQVDPLLLFNKIHPEDQTAVDMKWKAGLPHFRPYEIECRIKGANGLYRWFLIRAFPHFDSTGAITQWIGACTDVEDQRRIQNKLREAIKVRDEFLSIASHELKTPLTSLHMQLHIAKKNQNNHPERILPADKLDRVLSICSKQAARLARLMEDLTDVARLQSGKLSYQFALNSLQDILNEAVERTPSATGESNQEISLKLPEEPIFLICDMDRILQVFLNLISNAVKYAPGKPVEVVAGRAADTVFVEVRDQGCGIPQEKLGVIFERFERASPNASISGLGLGLYIARQICLAHGGSISVESRLDQGSVFRVTLPLGPAHISRDLHPVESVAYL